MRIGYFFQINITRYPAPYTSECVSDWSATNYSDFLPWDDFYYTLSQCQRFCLQSSFQQGSNSIGKKNHRDESYDKKIMKTV